jgi:hypothetical protein
MSRPATPVSTASHDDELAFKLENAAARLVTRYSSLLAEGGAGWPMSFVEIERARTRSQLRGKQPSLTFGQLA